MSDMNGTRGAIAYEESALKRLASEGWHGTAETLRELARMGERLRKPSLAALLDDRYLCERIGADLYLERAGHGAGFRDRDCWHDRPSAARIIGEALSAAVPSRGSLETYIGDDGETYIFGKES